jgi:hypothetical protein
MIACSQRQIDKEKMLTGLGQDQQAAQEDKMGWWGAGL